MNPILLAVVCIAGIGLVAAVVLAVADLCLSVREDPRIGLVLAALPGANCGGCGFATRTPTRIRSSITSAPSSPR